MKNRKNLFYISMFAICVLVFTACGDDETYDVYGDPIIECTFWIIPRSIR